MGMPPRSAAPATPRSDAGSPRTKAAVGDHGPRRETQTGTRTSGLEPRKDRSLRWRASAPDHVLGDRRFRDLEPKFEQFTMDARRAPQWVLLAHALRFFQLFP